MRCVVCGVCYKVRSTFTPIMSHNNRPGRGRPPKNSVWCALENRYIVNPSLGTSQDPPRPRLATDLGNRYVSATGSSRVNREADLPEPLRGSTGQLSHIMERLNLRNTSITSVDLEEISYGVGDRQAPYRSCTRNARDDSGQYASGYYASLAGLTSSDAGESEEVSCIVTVIDIKLLFYVHPPPSATLYSSR